MRFMVFFFYPFVLNQSSCCLSHWQLYIYDTKQSWQSQNKNKRQLWFLKNVALSTVQNLRRCMQWEDKPMPMIDPGWCSSTDAWSYSKQKWCSSTEHAAEDKLNGGPLPTGVGQCTPSSQLISDSEQSPPLLHDAYSTPKPPYYFHTMTQGTKAHFPVL